MRFLLKSKMFLLFNTLVFLVTILSLNYSVENYVLTMEERPFSMSTNYEVYERVRVEKGYLKSILNDSDSNYVMVLESHDGVSLGIYDPIYEYSQKATSVSSPYFLRYFSKEDYEKEAKVGICVNGCSLFDYEYLDIIGKQVNLEIINCFVDSPLAENGNIIVENLFSMNEEIGDHLYLDAKNKDAVKKLDEKLQKAGFKQIKKSERPSVNLLTAISFGLNSKYSFYLLLANALLLILSVITGYVYFEKMKNKLKLNFFYGCTTSNFFKTFFIPYVVVTMIGNVLVTGLLYIFIPDMLFLTLKEYIMMLVTYSLFLAIVYLFNFIKVYYEIKKGYRL